MITGRGGGSGKYSYRHRSSGNQIVHVSSMPEDSFTIRITFQHNGETAIPVTVIKLSKTNAEMLWAALNDMAKDLGWKDFEE